MGFLSELLVRVGLDGADRVRVGMASIKRDLTETGETAKRFGDRLDKGAKSLIDFAHETFKGKSALADFAKTAHGAGGAAFDFTKTVGGGMLNVANTVGGAALAFGGLQAALFGVAASAGFDAAKSMDSLTRGLASVSVDSKDLLSQLSRLKDVAKLPGLGFEEAVQGSLSLQAAGLSAKLSERSLMAFGNALATVGKGKDDLKGVSDALMQIASKGKVSAEEVNQINERVPQIRSAMNAAFGTADGDAINKMGVTTTQFIEGVVRQLEKLPKVTGGIGNAIENMADRWKAATLPLGQGIAAMFVSASPGIEKFMDALENRFTKMGEVFAAVGKSGVLGETLEKIVGFTDKLTGGDFQQGFGKMIAGFLTVVGNIPAVFAQVQKYGSEMFRVLGENAGSIAGYIGERFKEAWGKISEFIETVVNGTLGTIKDIGTALSKTFPELGKTLLDIGKVSFANTPQGMLFHTFADSKVPFPKLEGLPSLPDITKTAMVGFDENSRRVLEKVSPLPALPDGLNYGGHPTAALDGKDGPGKNVTAFLERIEENTRKASDALSLRRQALGGGELGQIGVTPQELLGGAYRGTGGTMGGAIPPRPLPSAPDASVSGLGRAVAESISAMMQGRMRRLGGVGEALAVSGFRPR